ncbi:hypothetical protein C2E23DRAFT_935968 [Lenzites betulinus]|nr:hypothetical protein C2E23DRAFT_935968 [Lenzites betulinus]
MSDNGPLIAAYDALIGLTYDSSFTQNCLGLSVMTIIAFEYVITFGQEIEYFWRRKVTGASVLFFMTRYLALVVNMVETAGFAPFTQNTTPLAIIVLLLSLVPLFYRAGVQHYVAGILDPIFGCEGGLTYSAAVGKTLTIITRLCLILADVITIAVTWFATYRTTKLAPMSGKSFATSLLRHGLIYFIVLFVLNLLHLVLTMVSIANASQSSVSYVTIYTDVLTAVLVSRFLLELQAVERSLDRQDESYSMNIIDTSEDAPGEHGGLVFGRVIGSIGSTVTDETW